MKSSEKLRLAAKRVEDLIILGGCDAICCVNKTWWRDADMKSFPEYKYFKQFKPSRAKVGDAWFSEELADGPRILALCFAAAIAESEGD